MTLYIHEKRKKVRDQWSEVYLLYLMTSAGEGGGRQGEILASWPFDGTEKRRQEVLRFIEAWTREHNITIGNPELWSLERVREERASGTKELV